MTTFGLLASPEQKFTPKRNRHTVENDQMHALLKRINRLYARKECDRKARIVNGQLQIIEVSTGKVRPNFYGGTVEGLMEVLEIQ